MTTYSQRVRLAIGAAMRNLQWRLRPYHQEFSIIVQQARLLDGIADLESAAAPSLTHRDVTDVAAAFVADPFLCKDGPYWYLFFEVLNKSGWKGEIGLAVSTDGLQWKYEGIVLREDFHLSYPYVFHEEGYYYMLPEGRAGGALTLYVADQFPWRWRAQGEILQGEDIADASILRLDGTWWLFAACKTASGRELRLFSSADLGGAWQEHPKSPISPARPDTVRPGGRIITVGGRLLRFAQGSKPFYGTNVHAIEIRALSSSDYQEEYLGTGPILGPGKALWNSGGMHHVDAQPYSADTWLVCADGWRHTRRRLRNLLTTLRHRSVGVV